MYGIFKKFLNLQFFIFLVEPGKRRAQPATGRSNFSTRIHAKPDDAIAGIFFNYNYWFYFIDLQDQYTELRGMFYEAEEELGKLRQANQRKTG